MAGSVRGYARAGAGYTAGAVSDELALRARFEEELRRRVPTRPWADLPGAVRNAPLGGVDGEVAGDAISASGLVVDGTLYVRGGHTRYGPYPYCSEMRHGVFSVTKSLGAAMALLRLAQKYGDVVFDAKIRDYVTVTASHDGWDGVTFADGSPQGRTGRWAARWVYLALESPRCDIARGGVAEPG